MQDQNQFRPAVSGRPAISGQPLSRGNYGGVAPRVAAPVPATPRLAAQPVVQAAPAPAPITAPAPVQPAVAPAVVAPAPITAVPAPVIPTPTGPRHMDIARPQTAPSIQPAAIEPAPITTTPQRPLFNTVREPSRTVSTPPSVGRRIAKHGRLGLAVVGIALLIGGGVKMATAGDVTGYTAAVGAVTVNDGSKTTIQFVADDGQLHRFSRNESKRELTPGTAVQVAYRPGAADATVVQVSQVQAARQMATIILASGVVLSVAIAIMYLVSWLKHRSLRPAASQAVPVSA